MTTDRPVSHTALQGMRGVGAQQRTLLSNRAAAHEKLGMLGPALDDCARILREVGQEEFSVLVLLRRVGLMCVWVYVG